MDTVKTALHVLELLGEAGVAGAAELARRAGVPRSTMHRNLVTLYEAGWIRPAGNDARRQWALSAKLLVLARTVEPAPHLKERALPVMERLRRKTGETIHLTVRDGTRIVLVERLDSPQPLRAVHAIGTTAPLHVMSNGKAILAHLSAAERSAYLETHVDAPVAVRAALDRELDQVRERGFALSDRGDADVRAVAAPILDGAGHPIAAMSISCPASRLPDNKVDGYGALVRGAAASIQVADAVASNSVA